MDGLGFTFGFSVCLVFTFVVCSAFSGGCDFARQQFQKCLDSGITMEQCYVLEFEKKVD